MKLFFTIKACSLLEITEKKILPFVEVIAIGRNSDTEVRSSDLERSTMKAFAHSLGISFDFHVFLAIK